MRIVKLAMFRQQPIWYKLLTVTLYGSLAWVIIWFVIWIVTRDPDKVTPANHPAQIALATFIVSAIIRFYVASKANKKSRIISADEQAMTRGYYQTKEAIVTNNVSKVAIYSMLSVIGIVFAIMVLIVLLFAFASN